MDFDIVLIAPEIPQNTGAIGRLCVCLGVRLHLIKPLGFSLADSYLKRAGLDYWKNLDVEVHENWEEFVEKNQPAPEQLFFSSTRGERSYLDHGFHPGSFLIFGNETHGLPAAFYQLHKHQLYHIPMPGEFARSHNLANAVAIIAYEAYRQLMCKMHL